MENFLQTLINLLLLTWFVQSSGSMSCYKCRNLLKSFWNHLSIELPWFWVITEIKICFFYLVWIFCLYSTHSKLFMIELQTKWKLISNNAINFWIIIVQSKVMTHSKKCLDFCFKGNIDSSINIKKNSWLESDAFISTAVFYDFNVHSYRIWSSSAQSDISDHCCCKHVAFKLKVIKFLIFLAS